MPSTTESPFDEKTLELLDRPWPSLAAEDLSLSSGFKHRLLREYIDASRNDRLWCKHTYLVLVVFALPVGSPTVSHSRESRHWLALLSLVANGSSGHPIVAEPITAGDVWVRAWTGRIKNSLRAAPPRLSG